MIATAHLYEEALAGEPVEEGFAGDLAYTLKKRIPFMGRGSQSAGQRKLMKKYSAMNQRRSEMGHSYG
jgi:hypothetical protein